MKLADHTKKSNSENNEKPFVVLSNYFNLDGKNKIAKDMDQLLEDCRRILPDNFVAFCNMACDFYKYDDGTWTMHELKTPDDLLGALFRNNIQVDFATKRTCPFAISWSAFFAIFARNFLPRYNRYSKYVSIPAYKDELVTGPIIKPRKNGKLDELVSRFLPLTEHDRNLIKALFITPAWGGRGGKKPLFVIAGGDDVPKTVQIGKSTLASSVQRLYESASDVHAEQDSGKLISALVEVAASKVVRIDNVRGALPWGILERTITSPVIFGHKMYKGHTEVPNYTLWILTANMPRITEDLATRSLVVRLAVPTYQGREAESLEDFIDENRDDILADIYYYLQYASPGLQTFTRFPAWEKAVLQKVTLDHDAFKEKHNKDYESLTKDTRPGDFHEYILGYIQHYQLPLMVETNISVDSHKVFITNEMMHSLYNKCFNLRLPYNQNVLREIKQIANKAGFHGPDVVKIKGHSKRGYWLNPASSLPRCAITTNLIHDKYVQVF
jgi:hypothetical protein